MVNVHQILVRARELYSSCNDDSYGMCAAINDAFRELNPEKISSLSFSKRDYIPEFNPYFLEAPFDSGYWWSSSDYHSRLEAFNKLIALYE